MTRRSRASLLMLAGAAWLGGGCVYYNGMYNTNRLAKSARKAERDGRPAEARNLWGQVITRAETLVVRHPRSKYAMEADVLRGLALARLDQCPAAVGPLGRADVAAKPGDLSEESLLALGQCQLELGEPGMADLAFEQLLESKDPARRREARFQHARALRMTGRYEEAANLLREAADPRGGHDLLLALAGAGRGAEALTVADSLIARNDTTFAWDSVITTVGQQDPRLASALVGRLRNDARMTPDAKSKRLYDDAVRLARVDSVASAARLRDAAAVEGRTEGGERARLELIRRSLCQSRTLEELAPHADSLAALVQGGSAAAAEAAGLVETISQVRALRDSAGPNVPQGDLRLFLGAESARDALGAPALAASLFRQVAVDWPASPYAPKALLAAQLLDPEEPEAAQARLDSLYPDSPYLAVLRGEESPGYRALEDSLQSYAIAQLQAAAGPRVDGHPGIQAQPGPGQPQRRREGAPGALTPSGRRRPEP
jgi:tetratricopeptide (TPR) repeat protein